MAAAVAVLASCAVLVVAAQGLAARDSRDGGDARARASASTRAGDEVIRACGDERDRSARVACYEGAFGVLVRREGVEPATAHISRLAARDPVLAADCHLGLHGVGDAAGRRLTAAGKSLPVGPPGDFCHQGYVHGLMIAYFDTVDLMHEAPATPSSCGRAALLEAWSCAHVFGHVYARGAGFRMAGASRGCQRGARSVEPWTMPFDQNSWISSCMKGAVMELALHDMDAGRDEPRPGTCDGVAADLAAHCWSFVSLLSAVRGESTLATQRRACVELAPAGAPRAACLKVWRRTARMEQLPPDLACGSAATAEAEREFLRCDDSGSRGA